MLFPDLLLKLKNASRYVCLCTNDRLTKMQAEATALDSGLLKKQRNLHVFLFYRGFVPASSNLGELTRKIDM